jgi:hypothetical protein
MGIPGSQIGGTVPFKAIFWGDIPLHRPYIALIYGRYLQFRILEWPLKKGSLMVSKSTRLDLLATYSICGKDIQ